MRTKLFYILLLFTSTTNAQIKIDYGVWGYPSIFLFFYTINNQSQDIYYSWIRGKENLSDEDEIKYHFFKRHRDFSLYNLIVDVEDYKSCFSQNMTEYLLIKIKPGDLFTYVFPMRNEFLSTKIFMAKENDVEKVIQSSIPKRLIYNGSVYFMKY